jgi:maltose-binding protein MalE
MNRTMLALMLTAGALSVLPACSQTTTTPPVEKKTEVKVKVDEDGDKKVTKETTVHQNPDGTKTETTKKTEVKTEVHDGKIIDLPGVEIRKKD